MNDTILVPRLSSIFFEQSETFLSAIKGIKLTLHNLEKGVHKFKRQVRKTNNQYRAKADFSVSFYPWGFSLMNSESSSDALN